MIDDLTYELVREIFHYEPASGVLSWKEHRSNRVRMGAAAGSIQGSGGKKYLGVMLGKKNRKVHRIIYLWMTGALPLNEIDHIDGNGLNNAWSNLRHATHIENARNQRQRITNTSGCMGVTWNKATNKWRAQIMINGTNKYLGTYSDFYIACAARKAAESLLGFHENHGEVRPL